MKILSSCEALPVWSNQPTCTFMQKNKLCTRRISTSVPFQIVGAALTFASTPQLLNCCTFLQRSSLRCAGKRRLLGRIEEGGKITRKIPWRSENCGNNTFRSSTDNFFLVFCTLPSDLPSVFKCCAYLVLAEKPSLSATVIYAIYV